MLTLGETFAVRDVMVPLSRIEFVAPEDEARAKRLVATKRYSVVPISDDGEKFPSVFWTVYPTNGDRAITTIQATSSPTTFPIRHHLLKRFFSSKVENGISPFEETKSQV